MNEILVLFVAFGFIILGSLLGFVIDGPDDD